MTHNPYEPKCIKNWVQLYKAGYNITVGVFGSIYNKDLEHKIEQVKLLKDSLNDALYC